MSRYVKRVDENTKISYGFSDVLGYFISVYQNGELIEDLDCAFYDRQVVMECMEKYKDYIDDKHWLYMAADLPF